MSLKDKYVPLALVCIGAFFLLANLQLLPSPSIRFLHFLWPTALILAGLTLLYYARTNPVVVSRFQKYFHWEFKDGHVRIGSWEPQNPLLRELVRVTAAVLAIGLTVLILLGVVTPVLILAFSIAAVAVVIALGAASLGLLIPLTIIAAPVAAVIWLIWVIFF